MATIVYLRCDSCRRMTTPEEAFYRVVYPTRCGHCGGAFIVAEIHKDAVDPPSSDVMFAPEVSRARETTR